MRKNASAPALVSLAGSQPLKSAGQGSSGHCSAGSFQHLRKREGRLAEGGMPRVGSNPLLTDHPGRSARQVRTRAGLFAAPPPSLLDEADQLVMEAPQGLLGSSQCIELYGTLASAPDLQSLVQQDSQISAGSPAQLSQSQSTSGGPGAGARKMPDFIQGRPELGGNERLAECLATPATVDDKNLGEIVDAEARQARAKAELRTQLRYAMETRIETNEQVNEEDVQDSAVDLDDPIKCETPHQARQRRRRRPAEDVYAYLQALGIDVEPSRPIGSASRIEPSSPGSQAAMAAFFSSSMDDSSNTLHLEDHCPPSEDEFGRRLHIAPSPSFRLQRETPSQRSMEA